MPTPTAADMVTLLTNALYNNPAAVFSVIVDGQTVQYSRAQAMDELREWERRAAKVAGTRPRTSRIRLDGAF